MKNIVVVGGTKGIGKHLIDLLTDSNVFAIARNNTNEFQSNVKFIEGDVILDNIDLTALPDIIDGLVYCPGSINLKPFQRLTEADFFNDWQLNFLGAVKITQALLGNLKRAPGASVVFFSTIAVTVGMPFHAGIASAKGAVEGLTRSLAAELAPKIRVNCISPSLTQTSLAEKFLNTPEKLEISSKRHPLQRVGQPGDIAELASFLLSAKASWITGQVIHIDGGLSSLKS